MERALIFNLGLLAVGIFLMAGLFQAIKVNRASTLQFSDRGSRWGSYGAMGALGIGSFGMILFGLIGIFGFTGE